MKRGGGWCGGRWLVLLGALGGFIVPWQTVLILRPGMLGGVAWSLATVGVFAGDTILLIAACVGAKVLCSPPPTGRGSWRPALRSRGEAGGWAGALLVALAVLNTLVSADPLLSAVGWARLIALILAVVGIPSWAPHVRRAFLAGFACAMVAQALLAFVQVATLHVAPSTFLGIASHDASELGASVLVVGGARWLRAYGGMPHPNVLGTALLVALAAVAVLRSAPTTRAHRVATVAAWTLMIPALLLTFSRAAWLGFIVLLGVLAWRKTHRDLAVIGAALALAFGIATAPAITERVRATAPLEARAVTERVSSARDALAFSALPPFFGVGFHAMPQAVLVLQPQRQPYTAQPAHSIPLLAAAEIGWIGIALLLLALAMFFPRGVVWRVEYLVLLPSFFLDHHLWSLAVGFALLLVFLVVTSASSLSVEGKRAQGD